MHQVPRTLAARAFFFPMLMLMLMLSLSAAAVEMLPAQILSPSKSWRSGAMSPTVLYDKATGMASGPTGTARVLHFERDGPSTVVEETFAQATSRDGQTRSSLTTVHYVVSVGSVTDDEGVTAPTLSLQPLKGDYRMVNNGVQSQRAIDAAELASSKFSGKTYAVVRQTDPNFGKPQEMLLMIELGANKKVDNTDTVLKYTPYVR